MAYRRRQGLSRSSTFNEGIRCLPEKDDDKAATTSSAALPHISSDSRLNSFRSGGAFHSSFKYRSKGSVTSDFASVKSSNERGGFWGVLARKAKAILEDDIPQQSNAPGSVKQEPISFSTSNQRAGIQIQNQNKSFEDLKKMDSPAIRIGSDRMTPSLNQIGYTIGNSLEMRKPELKNEEKNQDPKVQSTQPQKDQETLLQASRDVAIATAAKVKQLLRELKTVKAELASAKERCCRLEEENKLLLGAREKGDHPADDDMIRVQLETLLAEKGRLAHENSAHALENRYLREIVDFHQLTMQDLMYADEEGVIEVILPATPEAYQNMVAGPFFDASRYADDDEE
ncbi:uncharacterized protein LOC110890896 isoform X2 [Helianthus annuus]|uniref:uncharacterized protein LOC110890896 isoform X2 n=1 Tax=Helianthus annuus TaxID=4232 RepID=UPI000B8F0F3F|nr:uncharacterized protein LOC110890896 isoform X2 [Helianthus annuus]